MACLRPELKISYEFVKDRKFLITGANGFLGRSLARTLLDHGARVRLLDVCSDAIEIGGGGFPPHQVELFVDKAGITNYELVKRAAEGCHGVFHVASYGMSGREMLESYKTHAINVGGTLNVLRACQEQGVERLVYTSTTNVVFCGKPLVNCDESELYATPDQHVDEYSRSKTLAERFLLGYNCRSLRTCAIRPAGIYGKGEERHFSRICRMIQSGLLSFTIGSPNSRVEFINMYNLVHAHMLAMCRLTWPKDSSASSSSSSASSSSSSSSSASTPTSSSSSSTSDSSAKTTPSVAGKAYFVSDGDPVNNFEFLRPLIEGLGYRYPAPFARLPMWLCFYVAWLIEWLHWLCRTLLGWNFQPLLVRAEVLKTSVTHYFKPDRARDELGYTPLVDRHTAMAEVVEYERQRGIYLHPRLKHELLLQQAHAKLFKPADSPIVSSTSPLLHPDTKQDKDLDLDLDGQDEKVSPSVHVGALEETKEQLRALKDVMTGFGGEAPAVVACKQD